MARVRHAGCRSAKVRSIRGAGRVRVRAPAKDPLRCYLGFLGSFLSSFLGFFFILGSFFDSSGAVAVFRYALLARYRFNGRKSQGEIWAEILAGTLRGGESSGIKLGGGLQAAAT